MARLRLANVRVHSETLAQAALTPQLLTPLQAFGSRRPTASCLQNASAYTSVPVIQDS